MPAAAAVRRPATIPIRRGSSHDLRCRALAIVAPVLTVTRLFAKVPRADGAAAWQLGPVGLNALAIVGWSVWLALIVFRATQIDLARVTDPDSSGFAMYMRYAARLWRGESLYDPADLHGFHYLPAMLIALRPVLDVDPLIAGRVFGIASVIAYSGAIAALAWSIWPRRWAAASGAILGLGSFAVIPAFILLNAQLVMTAALIAATVAMMRERWWIASAFIAIAIVIKPLSIVFALLAGAAFVRIRLAMCVALAAALLAPFALFDWTYVAGEYANYVHKMWGISAAPPGQWPFQVDISTLFASLGLELPPLARLVIRAGAALVTLAMALRVARTGDAPAAGFAVLILSGLYITLFNPRNEDVSFLVVIPAILAIALAPLDRDLKDWRGWLWFILLAALLVRRGIATERWLKPAALVLAYGGLASLVIRPDCWRRWMFGPRAG